MLSIFTTCLLILVIVINQGDAEKLADPTLISTPLGDIQGFIVPHLNTNTRQFWNIPFAESPIGDRRWSPPSPLEKLPHSPYNATNAQTIYCVQSSRTNNSFWIGEEDCLYLTITLPASSTSVPAGGFPVLIYIYGGGFFSGYPMDASNMVAFNQAFIYVSINYRVGVLGFFPQSDLTAESKYKTSGNSGLQDQTAAIKWVNDYIQYFDGNPKRITIAGQSAGSQSVCMHLLMPDSAGLFQRGIMESGGCDRPFAIGGTLTSKEKSVGDSITSRTPCATEKPGPLRLKCLRDMDVDTIYHAQMTQPAPPGVTPIAFSPVWDGVIIPASPQELLASGRVNNVTLIVGTTLAENNFFLLNKGPNYPYNFTREEINMNINYYSGNNNVTIQEFYSPANYSSSDITTVLVDSTSAAIFVCAVRRLADGMSKLNNMIFHYLFDYVPPTASWAWWKRAGHNSEVSIAYNMDWSQDNEDRIISAQMQLYWMRFIEVGDPNQQSSVEGLYQQYLPANDSSQSLWLPYDQVDDFTLYAHNYGQSPTNGTGHFDMIVKSDWGQCALWNEAIPPKEEIIQDI